MAVLKEHALMSELDRPLRRARLLGSLLVCAGLACAAAAVPASAAVSSPRNLEVNHSIEMGVLESYPSGDVLVEVVRDNVLIAHKTVRSTGETVDINHVGGGDCWDGVGAGRSPDIRPGDKILATVLDDAGNRTGDVDFMFVRNVAFDEGVGNAISGAAFGMPTGAAFDLGAPMAGETLEARRADGSEATFTVRADGSFSGELPGVTGEGLFADHIHDTGGGTAITVTEAGGDGASACGARATTALTSSSHTIINQASVGSDLVVGGPRQAPTTVDSVTFGGKTYAPANDANTWTLTIPAADLVALGDNTDHQLVATLSDGSADETRTLRKDVTAPVLTASVAPGTYGTPQGIALSADGGEAVRYTLDGSDPGRASKAYDGIAIALGNGSHTVRAAAVDAAGNRSVATFTYVIALAPPATAPAGPAVGAQPPATLIGSVTPAVRPARPLTVSRLSAPKRIRAASARRNGVRLTMTLARGTRVLKVSVYRSLGKRRKLAGEVVFLPQRSGSYVVRLKRANLRRALKPGLYTMIATPGAAESALSPADQATASLRVIR
jgi:hypothetical protein